MIPNSKEKQSFLQTSGQDAGTQCLSRTRSVFRGHTVPLVPTADARRLFAPTAGTQCLSRLRRPLRKQTAKSLLSAPYGKVLQKQEKPPKDRKPSFRISFEKEKH